ncbi:quorum sensing histidine kinase QseC [Phytobacter massiliensis]|uniref:quorum sensing histidine kinase QseC n=1 Tax=Phytobacter massiliensis TaxID=1485952 RepID=UPI0002ED4777|nr:quorum sensing histidine kinase QseC [Phytobacter massiliensis]
MKRLKTGSLRLRLTLLFSVLAVAAWLCASLFAWQQTRKNLNELFDTQQMLFAKRLSTLSLTEVGSSPLALPSDRKIKHGHLDDDVLAFAIYTVDGRQVLHDGENGKRIPWAYHWDGFENGHLQNDDDEWRFLWLTSADGRYRIVVGQEKEYRQEMAFDIITSQLTPWLVALPLMLLLLIMLLSYELQPLKKLSRSLRTREPDSAAPLSMSGLPGEVRLLVDALNHHFARTHEMMARERRFTSDAAHELRSPLAALKVQTEVAQLSQDDPPARQKALTQLHTGIDRATRLVEQLLTLSRLDSLDKLQDVETVSLGNLLQSAVMDIYPSARQAGTDVRLHIAADVSLAGQPLLLSMMVRNLLDNAVRYSPPGSVVDVTLETNVLRVSDNGLGMSPQALARAGERFYRPPGQQATGSGLGLSIVRRIAQMHYLSVAFRNGDPAGFVAEIRW